MANAPVFDGDNFERLYARLRGTAPSLRQRRPDVSVELDALCRRLLERDPAERPADFAEVVGLLGHLAPSTSANT